MNYVFRSLAVIVTVLTLGGCASTRFVDVWQDPDLVAGKLNGEKIAAFLISEDESRRRVVEDALARELTARGAQGVAGYTLISSETAQDVAAVERKLREESVQAVVTLRFVSETLETTTSPATWHRVPVYRRWDGYWTRGWGMVYEPGQLRTDKVVQVETLIYEMEEKGLIWVGLSKTVNPGDADSFIRELSLAVDEEIKKTGLLR